MRARTHAVHALLWAGPSGWLPRGAGAWRTCRGCLQLGSVLVCCGQAIGAAGVTVRRGGVARARLLDGDAARRVGLRQGERGTCWRAGGVVEGSWPPPGCAAARAGPPAGLSCCLWQGRRGVSASRSCCLLEGARGARCLVRRTQQPAQRGAWLALLCVRRLPPQRLAGRAWRVVVW